MKYIALSGKNSHIMTMVDDEDFYKVSQLHWYLTTGGYVKGPKILLHRFILGIPPKGYEIDHINRNKLDNTRKNLRFLTPAQNRQNKGPYKTRNAFDKGIYKVYDKYQVRIRIKGKDLYLGTTNSLSEGAQLRNRYIIENGLQRGLNL